MTYVVLDTDVASHSFLGRLSRQATARLAASTACITFVTLGELTKWTEIRSWGPRRRESLERWLDRVLILDLDDRVPRVWGGIQARAQLRGRPRPVNDSWIAASCLVDSLPLATFNTKDYADFVHHEGLVLLNLPQRIEVSFTASLLANCAGSCRRLLGYAKCIDGQEDAARRRIEAALKLDAPEH